MLEYDDLPELRYRRDATFRTLVDTLEVLVHRCQFTPSELREGAVLACIHYEQRQPRRPPFTFTQEKEVSE